MKLIKLSPALAEIVELTTKKNNVDHTEKCTKFVEHTLNIVNAGLFNGTLLFRDTAHARSVRKSLKALEEFKRDSEIALEEHDYRELYGSENRPGILRSYRSWLMNDFNDEYLDAWENAKETSAKQFEKERKK
jgi:hypothetical protein